MKLLYMFDFSSNNSPPNLKKLWAEGYRALGLKATEGNGYEWHECERLAKAWHKMGGTCAYYAFLHKEQPTLEANYFWQFVKGFFQPGDWIAADAERSGVNGPVVEAFQKEIRFLVREKFPKRTEVDQLTYGSPGFLIPNHIVSYCGAELWEASYGVGSPQRVKGFDGWLLWQYTDHAHAPGMSGNIDESKVMWRFFEPELHPGDYGFCVVHLKALLHKRGYGGFLVDNMTFGLGVRRAVNQFKKKRGWPQNGIVGRAMWEALNA